MAFSIPEQRLTSSIIAAIDSESLIVLLLLVSETESSRKFDVASDVSSSPMLAISESQLPLRSSVIFQLSEKKTQRGFCAAPRQLL